MFEPNYDNLSIDQIVYNYMFGKFYPSNIAIEELQKRGIPATDEVIKNMVNSLKKNLQNAFYTQGVVFVIEQKHEKELFSMAPNLFRGLQMSTYPYPKPDDKIFIETTIAHFFKTIMEVNSNLVDQQKKYQFKWMASPITEFKAREILFLLGYFG